MIVNFQSQATQDIYDGTNSKASRKYPATIWKTAQRKLDMLNAAISLQDLAVPPGNKLEPLKGKLVGCHSIRINDQFRIIFRFIGGNAHDVTIIDYH